MRRSAMLILLLVPLACGGGSAERPGGETERWVLARVTPPVIAIKVAFARAGGSDFGRRPRPGDNDVRIEIRDLDGVPLDDLAVRVSHGPPGGGGVVSSQAEPEAGLPGTYRVSLMFETSGEWRLIVRVEGLGDGVLDLVVPERFA